MLSRNIFISCIFYGLLFTFGCKGAHPVKCSILRQGKFYYKNVTIDRYDSFQMVYNKVTGEVVRENIEWLGNCVYRLTAGDSLQHEKPVEVKILSLTKEYYTVSLWSDYYNKEFKDTIWIAGLIGGFKSLNDTFKELDKEFQGEIKILISEQEVKECDATKMPWNTIAGLIKRINS